MLVDVLLCYVMCCVRVLFCVCARLWCCVYGTFVVFLLDCCVSLFVYGVLYCDVCACLVCCCCFVVMRVLFVLVWVCGWFVVGCFVWIGLFCFV